LKTLPATVLNSPSIASGQVAVDPSAATCLLPEGVLRKPIVIHTGGVTASRCLKEVVESAGQWREDAALVITNVGDSPYSRDVRAAAAASPRRADIVLLPLVSRAEMIALQRVAAVGVSLTRGSDLDTMLPAPNKIAEYVHAGLLAVTTRSSFTERMADRGLALLIDSVDPPTLATRIDEAVRMARRGDTRARALEAARGWYCMDVQLGPVLEVLGYA
jgi:hypothetical protein